MPTKRRYAPVFILLCVLWTAVIFSYSLKNGATSSHESSTVTGLLSFIMARLGVSEVPSEHVVRKLAHFFEYFVLGGLSFAAFRLSGARGSTLFASGYAILVALADEFICQNISEGRGPQLFDVLLDSTGAFFGVIVAFLLCSFLAEYRKRKNDHKISKNA